MDSSKTRIWRGGLASIAQSPRRDEAAPPNPELHATRVMPIERLLPPPPAAPPPRIRKRRWPLVLAGVLTLFVVFGVQVRWMRARLAAKPADVPHVVEPAKAETSPRPVTETPFVQPAPTPPQPKASPTVDRSRLERAAVDAVISGDYAGAASIYRELEGNPAFRSAARILAARKAAP